jgi:hypothetical protein
MKVRAREKSNNFHHEPTTTAQQRVGSNVESSKDVSGLEMARGGQKDNLELNYFRLTTRCPIKRDREQFATSDPIGRAQPRSG